MPVASMSSAPDLRRLLTALLISALLHLGLALLPGRGGDRAADAGAPAQPTPLLTARLLPPAAPARPAKPPPRAGDAAPPSPSPPRTGASAPASAKPVPLSRPNRGAQPLGPVDLDIPEARLPTVRGTLVIRLWIDEQGRVTAFEAEPTDLPTEYVTAVGERLTEVRFAPALQEGQPVASVLRLEITAEEAASSP